MNKKLRIAFILILCVSAKLNAQEKTVPAPPSGKWVINEIYTSNAEERYGLFLELYNSTNAKVPSSLYVSDKKDYPQQFKLKSKAKFNPDWRKKGYRTFKVSALRFKRRTLKMYADMDTLYLFERSNYEYHLTDSFPVIWNDSLSLGRCGNRICYFNIPTPGRPNKNVRPIQYMPRRYYSISILGGTSWANNTGTSLIGKTGSEAGPGENYNRQGRFPSFGIKGQKVVNRRLYYTTTSAAIFQQGYSIETSESYIQPNNPNIARTRRVDGYYSGIELWGGKEIGLYLTPRFDLSLGGALVLLTYGQQVYHEKWTTTNLQDGTVVETNVKMRQQIPFYQMPVITFNSGFNYQLTSNYKIELYYNILFRTFQKTETIYYQSFNIGVSHSFNHKGRGYREGLLW